MVPDVIIFVKCDCFFVYRDNRMSTFVAKLIIIEVSRSDKVRRIGCVVYNVNNGVISIKETINTVPIPAENSAI